MSSSSDYGPAERLLHHLAFAHPLVQKALGDVDSDLFAKRFKHLTLQRPVFVTGLPRAGTTLLLDLFYRGGEFVTYTYRQMPFILSPLLWQAVSRPFQKKAAAQQRAHGDGMTVSFDSPEAFEEVIWLTYLRDRIVRPDRLSPLGADDLSDEFAEALRASVQKLLSLATAPDTATPRYLSKNNANISRIDALSALFSDAAIVIPFRQPLAHVGSLMTQHRRFSNEHGRDRFAKNYMRWLGHYEFGENFKPIDFSAWLGADALPRRIDAEFWLRYWVAAYRYVLQRADGNERIVLVDFDRLLRHGDAVLGAVAERTGIADAPAFVAGGRTLRAPTSRPAPADGCSAAARGAAEEVYERLRELAV